MKDNSKSAIRWISEVAGNKKVYIVILLLIQIILGASSVFYAVVLREIIDSAVAKNREDFFLWIGVLAMVVIGQIILRAANRYLEEYSRSTMENNFKKRLTKYLLIKNFAKVSAIQSGEWMNRLTSDTVVVADGLTQIMPSVAGMCVKMFGALVLILILDIRFGYILVPGGVLLIFLTYGFRRVLKRLHKKVQEADGKLRVQLQDVLSSMLVVRAFAKEEDMLKSAASSMEIHKQARMKKNHFSNICNIGFGAVMQGAYVLGAGVCGYGILTGTMSYGTFMAVIQLVGQVQTPFANITGYLPRYYAMIASAERLMEAEEYEDGTITNMKTLSEISKIYNEYFIGLKMKNVVFTYQPIVETGKDDKNVMPIVLNNVNLEINKGDYVAFTGMSGCGKSTIIKLLMSLYVVDKGVCYIKYKSGEKICLTSDYRRLYAYVPQGNHLMSGTIRDIVAFCNNSKADEKRIFRALDIACATEFVEKLKLGIDTVLGERGLGLSEGQMQRIAIARAIYADNPILMLDESTSALDEKTEQKLLINLRTMTDKTVLIVTHRSTILSICDKEIRFSKEHVKQISLKKRAIV